MKIFILLLSLFCTCQFLLADEIPEPFFFIVVADPQLFFKQQDDQNWLTTISHINCLKPDFVVVCGDLIQASNKPSNWKNPKEIKQYNYLADTYLKGAQKLKREIPLYNVAGNHDVSASPTKETIEWYHQRFGPVWYSFTHKKSLFVVLESNLIKDPQNAPDLAKKQLIWLQETLNSTKKNTFTHKFVFMHHPLCLKSPTEANDYFNMPKKVRSELFSIFHKFNIKAVFSGHYHRNAIVWDGDLELIVTSSCGAALGDDPLGFRIVKVYPDRIEHNYYSFESMPRKLKVLEKKELFR